MKAEFIGNSKHYTTGKVYEIRSKFCKVFGKRNAGSDGIGNVIAVYNMNDEAARYKFENSSVATIIDNGKIEASSNMPYRTYSTIEDFFKDWKVLEV
jgi:hypothetical protein